ncbi:protease complex subunit PrcB family protein [Oceanotoga sp. DSM 15011]|uniref:protease complex subunit PrcB family protein n=1 Tax=Oceanotoga sp. DSM 15011 TaxID=2984951 RepID=UPI0021F49EF5|nr:protease complex subunit PrcB family protein [Oceanotoga sp. DSM 15011]UYO99122.1 protease complex subunit PrcB family protein [Oceanotoga sp. DSM 15011]
MDMKLIFLIGGVVVLLGGLVFLGNLKDDNSDNLKKESPKVKIFDVEGDKFELKDMNDMGEFLNLDYEIVDKKSRSELPEILIDENGRLISVCIGKKSTGGYDLSVDKVYINDDVITAEINLKEPGSGPVTQAFTYPCISFRILTELDEGRYQIKVILKDKLMNQNMFKFFDYE